MYCFAQTILCYELCWNKKWRRLITKFTFSGSVLVNWCVWIFWILLNCSSILKQIVTTKAWFRGLRVISLNPSLQVQRYDIRDTHLLGQLNSVITMRLHVGSELCKVFCISVHRGFAAWCVKNGGKVFILASNASVIVTRDRALQLVPCKR